MRGRVEGVLSPGPGGRPDTMHIPDGFLSARVAVTCYALSAAGVGAALGAQRRSAERVRPALLGMTAAFVFVAQMVNFPVLAGTSGHLVGAVLATHLLGVGPAILVMTSVLGAQCFLFGDGGVVALGANVLNMGVAEPVVGGLLLTWLGGRSEAPRRRLAALACAAWCATLVSAVLCAGELAASALAPPRALLAAMGGLHALLGIGEAVMSLLVVTAILRARPAMATPDAAGLRGAGAAGKTALAGLAVLAALGLFVAPFASESPDALTRIARQFGLDSDAHPGPLVRVLLDRYRFPHVSSAALATCLAGAVGAAAAFGAVWLPARLTGSLGTGQTSSRTASTAPHRVATGRRVAIVATLVFVVATLPGALGLTALALVPGIVLHAIRARMPLLRLLRDVALAEPLVVGGSLFVLARPDGPTLFAALLVKAGVSFCLVRLLAHTTPLPEAVRVLRRARLPAALLETLSLLARYVPVLSAEATRMRRARAARTLQRGRAGSLLSAAAIIGRLFVRSTERAERIESAIRARSFS